jgi:hypothetical protein
MEQSESPHVDGPAEQPAPAPAPVVAKAPPPPLEYDRTPNHITRGQFRIFLILLTINTVAIVGYLWAPNSFSWARQAWREYQAKRAATLTKQKLEAVRLQRVADFQKVLPTLAAFTLPPNTPVYTEDGVESASLIASSAEYDTVDLTRNGMPPDLWQQPARRRADGAEFKSLIGLIGSATRASEPAALVLLRVRKNPSGADRLLLCEFETKHSANNTAFNEYTITSFRALRVRLVDPGSADKAPTALFVSETIVEQGSKDRTTIKAGKEETPQLFRILPGVIDPSDPTRARVPFRLNGAEGAFAITIRAGDELTVEPSQGRIVERGGTAVHTQNWLPSAPPAVRMTTQPAEETKR